MTLPEFLNAIRSCIQQGDTEKALSVLLQEVDGLGKAFKNDILLLSNRFESVRKQNLGGLLSNEDFQLLSAKLSYSILEIASSLEAQTPQAPITRNGGQLLYRIPGKMTKDVAYKCVVRIAYVLETLLKNIIVDQDTKIQAIRISEVMEVELLDPSGEAAFEIRTSTEEEQFLIQEDYTEWIFYVKPLKIGHFPLVLKIAVIELINEKERKRNIVFEKHIAIVSEKVPDPEESFMMLPHKGKANNMEEETDKVKEIEITELEILDSLDSASIETKNPEAPIPIIQEKKKPAVKSKGGTYVPAPPPPPPSPEPQKADQGGQSPSPASKERAKARSRNGCLGIGLLTVGLLLLCLSML